jgi:hypothetical protein
MPYYRAFLFDAQQHIFESVIMECDDDQTAMIKAAEITDPHNKIEVWEGGRMVGTLPGKG